MGKKKNYNYLLRLYAQVDEYLSSDSSSELELPEAVVSFCIVVEKIFKIRLYKKNPVLVFDHSKMKEEDALIRIIQKKEVNIETIKMRDIISRYKLMFKKEFSDDEMQVMIDIYNIRNHFIHGYKSDEVILSDEKNIIKKMGTVWERISELAIEIFGKTEIKANKPRNKYTEEELEQVLYEEVWKKIHNKEHFSDFLPTNYIPPDFSPSSFSGDLCPRCGASGFSVYDNNEDDLDFAHTMHSISTYTGDGISDLYKCKKCHLELTRKEYEIAKTMKSNKFNEF